MPTNAAMIAANEKRVAAARLNPDKAAAFRRTALRLHADKSRFEELSSKTNVPWAVIAVIKEREAGADPAFKRSIAQGDPWDKRSVHVPKNRGPFSSWIAAGIDALTKCGPYAALWKDWSAGGTMTILIKYNGEGYDKRGLVSPYGYAGTNQYGSGKYVADGVFDPNFVDPQLGCLGILLALQDIDPSAGFGPQVAEARPSAEPPKEIIDDATRGARDVRKGAVAGGAAAGGNEAAKTTTGTETPASIPLLPSYAAYSFLGIAVAVAIAATVVAARRRAAVFDIW
jgi:lysozyme family protein